MSPLAYVRGKVVKGFGRGSRELGCPTANVDEISHLSMSTGIYCGLAQIVIRSENQVQEDPDHPKSNEEIIAKLPFVSEVKWMVCSFGYNPHYNNIEKSLEVHILDDLKFNFYGAELRVLVCEKMRDEKKYDCLEDLKQDILNDIRNAKRTLVDFQFHASDPSYFLIT